MSIIVSKRLLSWSAVMSMVLATALQVVGVSPASAAGTCNTAGTYTVCLTNPSPNTPDFLIRDRIVDQVNATPSGAVIHGAMYLWTPNSGGTPVTKALIKAKKRGVDVKLVVGGQGAKPGGTDDTIKKLKDAGIAVTKCADGCLPNRDGKRIGAMHAKFFLIKDGANTVVMQTSTNLTKNQMAKANNLVISVNDAGLHSYYKAYWKRLNAKSWNGWTANADRNGKGNANSKAYVYPRVSGDPVTAVLRNVTACRAGNNRIWVAASLFDRNAVRKELNRLDNLGCDVRVAVSQAEQEKWLESPSGVGKLKPAKVVRVATNHNKLLVVDAKYAGSWTKSVWTGSHNLNENGLKNSNDAMLRITRGAVVDMYFTYLDRWL